MAKKQILIHYAPCVHKALRKLGSTVALRILRKIEENAHQEDPLTRAKKLTGPLAGKYRYRIGEYRVVFVVEDEHVITILIVLHIGHRRDIYRK
jgi:mRNA interferase RelE/StbE